MNTLVILLVFGFVPLVHGQSEKVKVAAQLDFTGIRPGDQGKRESIPGAPAKEAPDHPLIASSKTFSSKEARRKLGSQIQPGHLVCSACRWTAQAVRAVLQEAMPNRTKPASMRAKLAAKAVDPGVNAEALDGICASRRFPKDFVVTGTEKETLTQPDVAKRQVYSDFESVRSTGLDLSEDELSKLRKSRSEARKGVFRVCQAIRSAFVAGIVARAAEHTGRIHGAVTDEWLCMTAAQLCGESDGLEDPEADEDEL